MNDQRKVIYEQRREIMDAVDVADTIRDLREEVIHTLVAQAIPPHSYAEQWDLSGLTERVKDIFALDLPIEAWGKEKGIAETEIEARIKKTAEEALTEKLKLLNPDAIRRAEKAALLGTLDQAWKDHLLALDHVRQGIHLRGYGQRDPLNEYSREAFGLFELMLNRARAGHARAHAHRDPPADPRRNHDAQPRGDAGAAWRLARRIPSLPEGADPLPTGMVVRHPAARRAPEAPASRPATNPSFDAKNPATWQQTPRNAPCPCGSGKKYKHCHGAGG